MSGKKSLYLKARVAFSSTAVTGQAVFLLVKVAPSVYHNTQIGEPRQHAGIVVHLLHKCGE